MHLDFFQLKNGLGEKMWKVCDPAGDYGQYSAGILPNLEACYQRCKDGKLFDYEHGCKASYVSKGCSCTCYTKSDADGLCKTITQSKTKMLYIIKKPGKLNSYQ